MMVRALSSFVPGFNLESYMDRVTNALVPALASSPGLISYRILQRPQMSYTEVLILSTWKSSEEMLTCPSLEKKLFEDGSFSAIVNEAHVYSIFQEWSAPDTSTRREQTPNF